eukprot:gb/GEZN01000196.1/.p1 GENE.gb/GEZN01000196.1/~~gb/GEZN01000196.1/.p1  ORF type:complete len:1849 (-),score=405.96 gb/GEZN01000196.1/:204-5750(-)
MDKSFGMVWVPDEDQAWVPARLKSEDGGVLVYESDKGQKLEFKAGEIDKEKLEKVTDEELEGPGMDNLVNLGNFCEGGVLNELRKRYIKNEIYTSISTILISVNPYEMLPIYHSQVVEEYKANYNDCPSHVYKIGADAYKRMLDEGINQAVIISGESGAGKTEATKAILQYLSDVAGSTNNVEQQILQSNPVLEAFGNAKTVRNNNSSRFGKWMEIDFATGGRICAARIVNYLLEKSRVVGAGEGERNYHIFYQFLKGMPEDWRAKYRIGKMEDYRYMKCENFDVDKVDDVYEFSLVERAFTKLDFKEDETVGLWTLVSSVLNLGNLDFGAKFSTGRKGKGDGSEVKNKEHLIELGLLMDLDSTTLESAFTFRTLSVRGSVSMVPMLPEDAQSSCDALAKGLYGGLFDWLIKRINISLTGDYAPNAKKIGILDIFGFEIFNENSFEQFCINYCNEKLQQHFTNHIFKLEQEEYKAEGVEIKQIDFVDNIACLAMIEANDAKKGVQGILAMLDEEVNLPKGSDDQLIDKMHEKFGGKQSKEKTPFYAFTMKKRTYFTVNHYAGPVEYNTVRWLEKNKDTMPDSLKELVAKSGIELIQLMVAVTPEDFEESSPKKEEKKSAGPAGRRAKRGASRSAAGGKKGGKASLGAQFKNQLKALMDTLHACNPHYVRCIKPNSKKAPRVFDGGLVLRQMRYAGLFEAIKIRQAGYPFRQEFVKFNNRFRSVLSLAQKKEFDGKADDKTKCVYLLECFKDDLGATGYAVGKSKVLLRNEQRVAITKLRDKYLTQVVCRLQAVARAGAAREWFKGFVAFNKEAEEALPGKDSERLKGILQTADKKEYKMAILAKVAMKMDFLVEEARVQKMINEAIQDGELTVLEAALAQAQKLLSHPVWSPLFKPQPEFNEALHTAESKREEILRKDAARKQLAEAVIAEDLGKLKDALDEAKAAGLKAEDMEAADTLFKVLSFEKETMEKLSAALAKAASGTEEVLDGLGVALEEASKITMNATRVKVLSDAKESHLKGWFELLKAEMKAAKDDISNQIPDHTVITPVKDLPLAPLDQKVKDTVAKLQGMTYTDYSELVAQGNQHLNAQLEARVAGHMKAHLTYLKEIMAKAEAEAAAAPPTHETLKPVKQLPLLPSEQLLKDSLIPGLESVGYTSYADTGKTFLEASLKKKIQLQQKAHIDYLDAQIALLEQQFKDSPPNATMDNIPERSPIEMRIETIVVPNLAALAYAEAAARGGEFLESYRENVLNALQSAHFENLEKLLKQVEEEAPKYLPTKEHPEAMTGLPPAEAALKDCLHKLQRLQYHNMVRTANEALDTRVAERKRISSNIKTEISEAEKRKQEEEEAKRKAAAEEARARALVEQKRIQAEQKAKQEAEQKAKEEEEARRKALEEKHAKEEAERAALKAAAEKKAHEELLALEKKAKAAAEQKVKLPEMNFKITIDSAQDEALNRAAAAKDLAKLKELFAMPGMQDSQTHDARVARKVMQKLIDQETLIPNLQKAIEEYDVERLKELIKQAKNNGVEAKEVEVAKEIAFGMSLTDIFKKRLDVFVERKDLKQVKDILEQADQQGVDGEAVDDAKEYVATRDKQIRAEGSDAPVLAGEAGEDKAIAAYREWQSYAGLFPLKKCKIIRGPTEYAKGKSQELKAKRLVWQSEDIPSTILKLNAKYCGSVKKSKLIKRVAKLLFQNIRYYMGGRYHAYPATLAYQVLETCVGEPLLRDEVFAQIVKQTTSNPSDDSVLMGFKLLYMCLQCFRPGPQLMPVINSHLASAAASYKKKSFGWRNEDEVATHCYTLLADPKFEPTGRCPSMEEIEHITAGNLPSVTLMGAVQAVQESLANAGSG